MLSIIKTNLTLNDNEYRKEVHPKRQIVLHYTAGWNAAGALATWKRTPSRDGTAFVIDRDGSIHQVFDPRYWAVHVYRHVKGEKPIYYKLERESIGIEIVNVAWFTRKADWLYTYTDKKYCHIGEADKYVETKEWKKRRYWQPYTADQYAALRVLLPELSRDFQIPLNLEPPAGRIDPWSMDQLAGYTGVTTHCNYRKDKYDVGPAFDWEKAGLTA